MSLVLKLVAENLWKSMLVLLDANLDEELQGQIEGAVLDIPGVKDIEDVKIRQAGPFRIVELKFTTNPSITIYQAHAIADDIEDTIQQKFNSVESVLVHAEPSQNDEVRAIVPVKELNGMDSKIYDHFGRAPYFAILNIRQDEVTIEDLYLNEFLDRKKHIDLHVVKVLVNYDLDMLFTSKIGEISFSLLKENCIDIYQVKSEDLTLERVIERYRQNQLARIIAPTHSVEESITEMAEPLI